MDDLPDSVNGLVARLEVLERRVYALEHPPEASITAAFLTATSPAAALEAAAPGEPLPWSQAGGALPVLGRALLGIAGAYLLRAVEQSTSLPKLGVASLAIVYAMLWLLWATRVPVGAWFASTTYACTSAVILAPMLWELTLNFKVLPPTVTAAILCAYVISASALAWKRDLTSVLWVANGVAASTALALAIGSHQLLPFAIALLVIVALAEYAADHNHALAVRPLVALLADIALWAIVFIYSGPPSARADFPVLSTSTLLAPSIFLLLIYLASIAFKTLHLKQQITVFETLQAVIAFLLAACTLLTFLKPEGAAILGILCLAFSVTSYAAVSLHFDRAAERHNARVFSAFSAALLLAGSFLLLSPTPLAALLGTAAVAATFCGIRFHRLTLEIHGLLFLLAAAIGTGLLTDLFQALAGTLPAAPTAAVLILSFCAVLVFAAQKRTEAESWTQQAIHLLSAALAIGATAALAVQLLVWLIAFAVQPGPHHIAFLRTLILCAAALALGFFGPRLHRLELTRIGYAALGLVALKLVFEDLRHARLEFIAASVFTFAVTLLLVPRLARMAKHA